MRLPCSEKRRLSLVVLVAFAVFAAVASAAVARGGDEPLTQTVPYHGLVVSVPSRWSVGTNPLDTPVCGNTLGLGKLVLNDRPVTASPDAPVMCPTWASLGSPLGLEIRPLDAPTTGSTQAFGEVQGVVEVAEDATPQNIYPEFIVNLPALGLQLRFVGNNTALRDRILETLKRA